MTNTPLRWEGWPTRGNTPVREKAQGASLDDDGFSSG